MAQDDEPRSPAERALIEELEQLYHEEAQAVEHRLARVWQRVEQHPALQQSRQEPAPPVSSIFPRKRRVRFMKNPLSPPPTGRRWSTRASALAAAALLVILVGGLTTGLILVRHGTTSAQATPSPTAQATSAPTPTPTPAGSGNIGISTLDMIDATTGWAAGYSYPIVSGEQTQILHTTDGGAHWKNVTPHASALSAQSSHAPLQHFSNGAGVRTEQFINGSVAWELVLPNQFFKTTNGGQTWQQETAPGQSMRQFTFLDDLHGWAIAEDQGAVVTFRTTDGGATWTKIQSSTNVFPPQTPFWGMRFLNTTTGWAVFLNTSVGSTATLYMTQNSGATWRVQRLALPAGAAGPISVNPPQFFNDRDGIIQVGFDGGIRSQLQQHVQNRPASGGGPEGLYVTHDGGITWSGPIVLQGLEFPDFIDALHGWALNSNGSGLLTTSDSGRHWTTVQASSNFVEIDNLSFVSSQIGWALKNNSFGGSFLLRTVDGGRNWTQLNLSISN